MENVFFSLNNTLKTLKQTILQLILAHKHRGVARGREHPPIFTDSANFAFSRASQSIVEALDIARYSKLKLS